MLKWFLGPGILSALGVLVVFVLFPRPQQAQTRYLDVVYAETSSRQTLDLYLPLGTEPFALIVFIHGGGFMSGNKRGGNAPDIIQAGLERGYAVASVNYRRSGEAPFPAAADDVSAAIAFLREEASAYGVDPNRFVVWGASAGGNLAAMAATRGSDSEATAVKAAVIWFAPIAFDQMDAQFEALGLDPLLGETGGTDSPESQYLGMAVGNTAAADSVRAANPMTYITEATPPMVIQHGTTDRNIPITQSEVFARTLADAIGQENVVLTTLEGAGHGGAEFTSDANMDEIFAFLDHQPSDP